MRIRSIKPEFWRSVDITSLDIADRFLFIGLWSYVDDNGVGVDDDAAIIGDLFARDMFRDSRETVARVTRGLETLSAAGLIDRYTVSGRPFLFITNWEKHQRIDRPGKPRFPRPDDENAILATPSRDPRETPSTGTGEQGNRGTEEQGSSSSSSEVADATPRHDVEELLDLLDAEIEANGGRKPNRTKKNHDAIRLMLDRDNIPASDIAGAIRWCQADEFWRSNILSASKLRDKYDTLRAQARRKQGQPRTFAQQKQDNTLALIAELREEEARGQVAGGNAAGVRAIDSGR